MGHRRALERRVLSSISMPQASTRSMCSSMHFSRSFSGSRCRPANHYLRSVFSKVFDRFLALADKTKKLMVGLGVSLVRMSLRQKLRSEFVAYLESSRSSIERRGFEIPRCSSIRPEEIPPAAETGAQGLSTSSVHIRSGNWTARARDCPIARRALQHVHEARAGSTTPM